jgi:hypothetical protein
LFEKAHRTLRFFSSRSKAIYPPRRRATTMGVVALYCGSGLSCASYSLDARALRPIVEMKPEPNWNETTFSSNIHYSKHYSESVERF